MNIRKIVATACLTVGIAASLTACSTDGSRAGESELTPAPVQTSEPKKPEVVFLDGLDAQNIPYTTAEKAVAGGKAVCRLLDEGNEWFPLAIALYAKWGPAGDNTESLTQTQVGVVMRGAVYAFCPQHENLIP